MTRLDFKKYNDEDYITPKILIEMLEEEFQMSFNDLKEKIESADVTLTKEKIEKFLTEELKKKYPDVAKRNEERKKFYDPLNNINKVSPETMKYLEAYVINPSISFSDSLVTMHYEYEPELLNFYLKNTDILKTKIFLLFNIIEKINVKDEEEIEDLLNRLDIVLNSEHNIKYEDIIRLIKPTIYCIGHLFDDLNKANDLNTYIGINKVRFSETGISFLERATTQPKLQEYNLDVIDTFGEDGYVPLSNKQREEIERKDKEYFDEMAKILIKEF